MRRQFFFCALLVWLGAVATAAEFATEAQRFHAELKEKFLPYWFDTAQDKQNGGYLLSDDLKGKKPATEKQLVSQARMIWGFSHAHLKGFSTPERNYLQAADQGYQFLQAHFRDARHGGYFWTTDLAGKVKKDTKIIYGNSFVIYALVEYHRASGKREPLDQALALFRTIKKHAHDSRRDGWIEHFQRDWRPILDRNNPAAEVEVAGLKSANTHLHLMEAYAELYDATRSGEVRKAVQEALRLNKKYFYPKKAGESCFHRQLDWKPVTDPRSAGLSYGHNVEFAWLMVRAEQVLGKKPSWDHFYAHIDHALRYGYDHARGGLYNRGLDDQPANQTDKVWWVQSEMLAALADALRHRPNPEYSKALASLIRFIREHQADPADGIWLDTVTAEGKPKSTAKAHNWKANYHDVRALVKFSEAFSSR